MGDVGKQSVSHAIVRVGAQHHARGRVVIVDSAVGAGEEEGGGAHHRFGVSEPDAVGAVAHHIIFAVAIPDSVAIIEHPFKFLVGKQVESQHQASVHHPWAMAVVVRFSIACFVPHGIHILHAEIEVFGIVGCINGIRVDYGILMLSSESRSYVASHALAYQVVVGPVRECIIGATLVVSVGISRKFGVHSAVATLLTVGIHTIVIGDERIIVYRNNRAFGVGECLVFFRTLSRNGKRTQFGGSSKL